MFYSCQNSSSLVGKVGLVLCIRVEEKKTGTINYTAVPNNNKLQPHLTMHIALIDNCTEASIMVYKVPSYNLPTNKYLSTGFLIRPTAMPPIEIKYLLIGLRLLTRNL